MKDTDCVAFLQWALPTLRFRWPGFRKVRKQVCKRIDRRIKELGLADVPSYRGYLQEHPGEWAHLDELCRIPITRFYRDKAVFRRLADDVLPTLAERALAGGDREVRAWSIGCASGEEPSTLLILWRSLIAPRFPALDFRVVATDVSAEALARAQRACYPRSSLKDLPPDLREEALKESPDGYCLKEGYSDRITYLCQDIRREMPDGVFHLILCRYLVFTYFDEALQRETLERILTRLVPGGTLVLGAMEALTTEAADLEPWFLRERIYRKRG
jgi:chemotaxis protein methyltransferase CheR